MLVPVMGLTSVYFMKYSLVADHYQHLALIGVVALAGSAWARWNFKGAAAVAAVAVGALACLTWRQCLNYRDAETLYRATIASDPSSWMAHNNLGRILSGRTRRSPTLRRRCAQGRIWSRCTTILARSG
jgi:hypothetical protein